MFYIIDHGVRIQTPVDSLTRPHTVQALEKAKAMASIGSDQRIDDDLTDQAGNQAESRNEKVTQAYLESSESQQNTRQAAVFAQQVMTHPAVAINEKETVYNATRLLKRQRFHHLPVTNQHLEVTGIITDRDLMRFSLNHPVGVQQNTTIATMMSKQVITAATETEIRSMAEVMCLQSISAIPITDEHKHLVGIVSSTDIMRTLVNQAPLELWA